MQPAKEPVALQALAAISILSRKAYPAKISVLTPGTLYTIRCGLY